MAAFGPSYLMEQNRAYHNIKKSFEDVQMLNAFPNFSDDERLTCLSMKYGYKSTSDVLAAITKVPDSIPEAKRKKFIVELASKDLDCVGEIYEHISKTSHMRSSSNVNHHLVFGPPTRVCLQCVDGDGIPKKLSVHNKETRVRYYSLDGVEERRKLCTRCDRCLFNYNICHFGKKDKFRLYNDRRGIIEVTDGVIVDRRLFERYVNTHVLSAVTFEGFTESYNMSVGIADDKSKKINRELVSRMYYVGEVEEELRRLGLVSHTFNTVNLFPVLEMLDERRQKTLYTHDCTPYCEKMGCGKLHIMDGIWKIIFTVCAMRTENTVNGLPLLQYPDVCVKQPATREAFCKEHQTEMKKLGYPTNKREFLTHCGIVKGTKPVIDPVDKVIEEHPTLKQVGEPSISTHRADLVNSRTREVQRILSDCKDSPLPAGEEPCNKDTGIYKSLNMKSRGYMYIVTAGGFIETFNPIYRAESPSQEFLMILSFLYILLEDVDEEDFSSVWISYDNMCNLTRLKIAMMEELPLPGKFKTMWQKVNKIIDGLHITNHKRKVCHEQLHPQRFEAAYPYIKEVNTMAAEQLFAWLGHFKKQLCSLPKQQQLFMLHRLAIRRNDYTSKCHKNKRDPVFPRIKKDKRKQKVPLAT